MTTSAVVEVRDLDHGGYEVKREHAARSALLAIRAARIY
jgi:hypothetical protein